MCSGVIWGMTPFCLVETTHASPGMTSLLIVYILKRRQQVTSQILPNYTASFSGRLCYGTRQGSFHLQVFRKVRPQVNETPQGQRNVKTQVFCGTTLRPYVIASRRFEGTKRPYLPKRRMSTTQGRSTVFQNKRMFK
jgi:hypothetical protein